MVIDLSRSASEKISCQVKKKKKGDVTPANANEIGVFGNVSIVSAPVAPRPTD